MKKIKKILGTTALCTALLGVGTGCSLNFDPTTSSDKDDPVVVCTQTDLDTLNQRLTEKQAELDSVNALLQEAENNLLVREETITSLTQEKENLNNEILDLQNQINSLSASWRVEDLSGDYIYSFYGTPNADNVIFVSNDSGNIVSYASLYQSVSVDYKLEDGKVKMFNSYIFVPRVYSPIDKSILSSLVRTYEVLPLASGTYDGEVSKSTSLEIDKNKISLITENYLPNYDMNEYSVSNISIYNILELAEFDEYGNQSTYGMYLDYNSLDSVFNLGNYVDVNSLGVGHQFYLVAGGSIEYTSSTNTFRKDERIYIPISIVD